MLKFDAILERFHQQGEKTGWTYIAIPLSISEKINPGIKKSYRVKGKIDDHNFEWVSTVPMGDGTFIIAVNATMRKAIRKSIGETVTVHIEKDNQEKPLNEAFLICLADEPDAQEFFNSLPRGHQRYFSNWIDAAKTESTLTKRIAQAVNALALQLGFGEMIRKNKG